jgi:hypothetical protein
MKARLCIALALLFAPALLAQTYRGAVVGTVTDSSGAVVSGATVTVHNDGTGIDRTTQTGADGTGRGIGSYALTATGDVGIGNPFLGGGGPRGIQFAAKVSF